MQALPGYEAFIYGKRITKKHEKSNQVNDWVDQELVGPSCTYSVLQSLIGTSQPSSFFICSSCTSSFIVPRLWLASNCVFVADIDQFECAIDPLKTIYHLPTSTECILIDLILCGGYGSVGHFGTVGPLDLDQRAVANRSLLECFTIEAAEHGLCFANPCANFSMIRKQCDFVIYQIHLSNDLL